MKFHWLVVLLLFAGCSAQSGPSLAEVNNTNIKKLRAAYGLYLIQHNMQGPGSEEELKAYLRDSTGAQAKLNRMGLAIDDLDSVFISERDGQPFKVRYGLRGMADFPIVFEAEGVDGKRMIAYNEPREVEAAEYDELWEGKERVALPAVDLE